MAQRNMGSGRNAAYLRIFQPRMDTNKRELQRLLSAPIRGFPLKVALSKRHSGQALGQAPA
jgi:hypothetical protein